METKKQARWRRLIRKAANILRKSGWTKATLARTDNGRVCDINSPYAKCFCMIGAILKASGCSSVGSLMDVKYYPLASFVSERLTQAKKENPVAMKALQELAAFYNVGYNTSGRALYSVNDGSSSKEQVIEKMLKVANQ